MGLELRVRTRGGKNLKRAIRKARAAQGQGVSAVAAGYLPDARYPNGMPVAHIAAVQEFGATMPNGAVIPERPAMRLAASRMREGNELTDIIKGKVDAQTLTVDAETARAIGQEMVAQIQSGIDDMNQPQNAPITRKRKRGQRPLVDSGTMRESVDYELI